MNSNTYSRAQKYFNNCLKEFYESKKLGKLYHYTNPGLLLTHTNYKRTPPHINKLLDTSIWFPINSISKDNQNSTLNILHLNPDYNVTKRIITHSNSNSCNHIIFTNSYHLEFLSFIEACRLYDMTNEYQNLRLVTGSYCAFHLIFYERLFHYIFLYINKSNYRNLLRLNVIRSLHNSLYSYCKIIFITQDEEISQILYRHSESDLELDSTNPLICLLFNLNNKFIPEFQASKYFTGINLQGLSRLNDRLYSLKDNIASSYDSIIADYIYRNDDSRLHNKADNLSERFFHKYYRIDKNIPNLRLVKPITM